jgi:hypothetical protein
MTEQQSGRESAPTEPVGRFRQADDRKHSAAETLVEGTVPSSFAAEQFSADATFEILSHPGRRYVLTYLLQSTGTVSLSTLVDYAVSQRDESVDDYFRDNIATELTHAILPKLDEAGFVSYHREQQAVESTELTATLEPYLRLALVQQDHAADLESDRD